MNSRYRADAPWPGTPLEAAAARGHLDVMSRLIDAGADPNVADQGETLLKRLRRLRREDNEKVKPAVIELLVRRGAVE